MGTVTRVRSSQPKAAADGESKSQFTNLIDLGDRWLVKCFVSPVQLRTLVGRKITGIAPHPQGGGRSVPVYDVAANGWLAKWFAFEVPKQEGVYDLSCRAVEVNDDTDEVSVHIESTQVMVEKNAEGVLSIRKLGYGEMVEHFGGTRLQRGADGALSEVSAQAESF